MARLFKGEAYRPYRLRYILSKNEIKIKNTLNKMASNNEISRIGIITIDGPAGAGKSTVARQLALLLSRELGVVFEYIDTGSMYRAATLHAIRNNIDWNNADQIAELTALAEIDVVDGETFLNGENVTQIVRAQEITKHTKFAADNNKVRLIMIQLQQTIANKLIQQNSGVVTEGRDQGTLVFPDADCKFYLTASPVERAKRRCSELRLRGVPEQDVNFDQILNEINQRDERDKKREFGALRQADDAIEIKTDGIEIPTILEQLTQIVIDKLSNRQK
ncbi:MAG: (d)CMP kinase, partial [Planctomycetaceae bacterium]|nr:(d)CMP kinase [Planctomycetaceae bacterium]